MKCTRSTIKQVLNERVIELLIFINRDKCLSSTVIKAFIKRKRTERLQNTKYYQVHQFIFL